MNPPFDDHQGAVELLVRIRADRAEIQKTLAQLEGVKKAMGGAFLQDNATVQAAKARLAQHRAELARTRDEAQRVNDVYHLWGRALNDIARENVVRKLTADLTEATKTGKDLDVVMERVKVTLQSIGASQGEVTGVVRAAQTAAQAGSGGGKALQALGREARLSIPAIPIPGTGLSTESIFRVGEIAGKLGLDFKQLALTGGLASIAVVGLALAIKNFQDTIGPVQKLIQGIVDAQRESAGILATEGPEGLVSKREQALTERQRLEAEQTVALQQQAIERQNLANAQPPPALEFLIGNIAAKNLVQLLAKGPLEEATAKVEDYNAQIAKTKIILDDLNKTYAENLRLVENAKRAQQEVQVRAQFDPLSGGTAEAARTRQDAILAERSAIQQTIETTDLSTDALNSFMEQFNKLGDEFKLIQSLLPRLEGIEAQKKAQADQEEAQKKFDTLAQRVVDTQAQGQERLAALAEQGAKQIEADQQRVNDAQQKLADSDADSAEKRAKTEAEYFKSERERTVKFRKDLERVTEDSNDRLLELTQKRDDAELEAQLKNDVTAFQRAQRNFERQSEDEKKTLDKTTQRRLEDYNAESQKNREVLADKLADLDTEAAKRHANLQAELDDRAAALQATKDDIAAKQQAEEAAIKASLSALVESFDTSTQAMTQTGVQAMRILQQAGIDVAAGIVGEIQRAAGTNYTSQRTIQAAQPDTARIALAARQTPLVRYTGFAAGTPSTRALYGNQPGLVIVNDQRPGMDEAIIPYPQGMGLEAALAKMSNRAGGGGGQSFHFDFSGADFGSHNEQRIKDTVITAVAMSMHGLRTGQRPA